VNASPVTATGYTDGRPGGQHHLQLPGVVDGSSGESALSRRGERTTKSSWTCTATTSSNYAHVQAGRAHDSGGYALANGSNQNMGPGQHLLHQPTLAQTSVPAITIIGSAAASCP
jgi:poly(3-hydroxybutyrate) depolymerase